MVDVVDVLTGMTGNAPIVFGSNAFTVTIPLTALRGDDGYVNVAALMAITAHTAQMVLKMISALPLDFIFNQFQLLS